MQLKGVDLLYLQNLMAERPEKRHNAAYPQVSGVHNHGSGILPAPGAGSNIPSEDRRHHISEIPLQDDALPEHSVRGCYENMSSGLMTTHNAQPSPGNTEPNLENYAEFVPSRSFEVDSFLPVQGYPQSGQVDINNMTYQYGRTPIAHWRDVSRWDQSMGSQSLSGHRQRYPSADHYQPAGKPLPDV